MLPRILVVDSDKTAHADAVSALRQAGYEVSAAYSFAEAKAVMTVQPPALLITTVRLGPFNGLHLVAFGRAQHAQMAAIVLGQPVDRALSADASRLGASFAEQPLAVDELLQAVSAALEPTLT